jgi:hypothetical protein
MNLQQVAMTNFVLLRATWPVEQSRQLIERLQPSHVIVHHHDLRDAHYLFSAQEALTLLAQAPSVPSVYEALHLNERGTTPVAEGDIDAERVPDQCIVLEEGRLVGFFDVTVPPQWTSRKGGDESFPPEEPAPELRSLVTDFPECVSLQAVFSLLVSLSASSPVATSLPDTF